MPNHLHGIIVIHDVGAHGRAPQQQSRAPFQQNRAPQQQSRTPLHRKPKSLGSLIAGFKSVATKKINIHRQLPGCSIWQRNYFDRIIRDEDELHKTRHYIQANPLMWAQDNENPVNF